LAILGSRNPDLIQCFDPRVLFFRITKGGFRSLKGFKVGIGVLGKKKPTSTPVCPQCGGKLYYDGKGLRCMKCLYLWRPDKKIVHPSDPPPAVGEEDEE